PVSRFVPMLPRLSFAVSANLPSPEPMAGVRDRAPLQLLPAPESTTGRFVPAGGANTRVGGLPEPAGFVSRRLTPTLVPLVVWTGGVGDVVRTPAGGVVSMVRAVPSGLPLNTLPTWS